MTALWFSLLARARLYRRLALFELSLADTPPARPATVPVELRLLAPGDVAAHVALRPDVPPGEVLARLGRGERCFTAWHEGRLVSTTWAATGRVRIDYLDRDLALAPGDAYAYDAFTAPDYRGREIAGLCTASMQRALRAAGVRRLLAAHLPENRFVRGRTAKRPQRDLGVIGYVGLGPWRRHFLRERAGEWRRPSVGR